MMGNPGQMNAFAFCWIDIGLPEQAVGWFPLGLGLVIEDTPIELLLIFHGIMALYAVELWSDILGDIHGRPIIVPCM